MKPNPNEIISAWQEAYRDVNGREPNVMSYEKGWYTLQPYSTKFRASAVQRMTKALRTRISTV